MRSDCVLLGGFLILVGALMAIMSISTKDPLCHIIGGGIGIVFPLVGVIILIEGFLKGGIEE